MFTLRNSSASTKHEVSESLGNPGKSDNPRGEWMWNGEEVQDFGHPHVLFHELQEGGVQGRGPGRLGSGSGCIISHLGTPAFFCL